MKMIEDPNNNIAQTLSIIKICSKRQSVLIDQELMQKTNYPSQWYVALTEEGKNSAKYREELANKFITFMNGVQWLYPQQFVFSGDETKSIGNKIISTLDMYLLNSDIAAILKTYIFESWAAFVTDKAAISAVFAGKVSTEDVKVRLFEAWEQTPDL